MLILKAKQHYLTAAATADKENLIEWQAQMQNNLGSLAMRMRDYKQAESYLQKTLLINSKHGFIENQMTTYQHMGELCEVKRQWRKAHQFRKRS